jgi:hypothetical protein
LIFYWLADFAAVWALLPDGLAITFFLILVITVMAAVPRKRIL